MTLPNGIAGISDAIGDLFAITGDPTLISSGNWGISSISQLPALTQTFVTDLLKANVIQASNAWNAATADVWAGLRRGDPFGGAVSLPLAIIEQMVSQLLGLPPGTWESVDHALAAIEGLPGITQIISLLTKVPSVTVADAQLILATWGTNIHTFLGAADFASPDFNLAAAATSFVNSVLAPLNLFPMLVDGFLPFDIIPDLNINQITALPGYLATMFSPFNPPHIIGAGQVTTTPQNLLKNWNFPDANSLAGETVWTWDAANPATGGSAKVNVAVNANTKALLSDPIQVVAKDTLNVSAFTKWSGLTFAGTPISLKLNLYDASNALLTQITLVTATMTGATSSWVQLSGIYTIPDDSTAMWARLVYSVTNTATAGSVWFTNGSLTKPNAIPQVAIENLTGILGGSDIGSTIQNFLDKGVQGIVNDAGSLVDNSIATWNTQMNSLARFLGFVASGAAPPGSVAQIASNVDNTIKARAVQKAFNENIDPTTDATFPLSQVWQNATLPVVASTAGATVIGDITIRDGGDKNAVTWYGYPAGGNFGSISDFRVNVYSINKTTNVRTKVHGSANIVGSVGTGTAPVFNSYNLPASIQNTPGDRLSVEIAILGAGTYYLVGQTISGQLPFHSVYGLHGLTRASATAPTTMNPPGVGGSPLSYSRAIPWFGTSGTQSATQYTPVLIPFYGSGSFDPSIYQWANYFDIVQCSGGGGGGGGGPGAGSTGGGAGSYNGVTLTKAQMGLSSVSINVAGPTSTMGTGNNGETGHQGYVSVPGYGTLYSPGGGGGGITSGSPTSLGTPGAGSSGVSYNGQYYAGGAGGGGGQGGGSQPGGGGGGGNSVYTNGQWFYGGPGASGIAYIRAYQ